MQDNTRRRGFRPAALERNSLFQRLEPWSFARLLEQEAEWLLQKAFPVWAEYGDPLTRLIWLRMCHSLLIETGATLEDSWKLMNPEGEAHLFCRYMPDGLRAVVGLTGGRGGRQVQVHLAELVYFELRRQRSRQDSTGDKPFTFMDVMREEYVHTPDVERQDTTAEGLTQTAAAIASSWKPSLREQLSAEETWRLPMPRTTS
ncbi:hypothetical protein [Deinococcus cavernae]|nr:hypothetical protein [Deinococcus cavernae]